MNWRAGPYDEQLRQRLEAIRPGLAQHLDGAPSLDDRQTALLLQELLDCACAQNARKIILGRSGLLALLHLRLRASAAYGAKRLVKRRGAIANIEPAQPRPDY